MEELKCKRHKTFKNELWTAHQSALCCLVLKNKSHVQNLYKYNVIANTEA